ncbi:MAG: sigma-70 family RNA polymerase sigma factor [Bacteroidales bacterium]|nr:sigma-70 family RNA polymerase sigma factor [Bacteroidales bacterium]
MKEHPEVQEWVRACREGNARAQRKLFKHFYGLVMRICMRYAGSTDEASDMLNEGFLKVFSNLDKYENTGSFEAWLKRVVCNAALDYRRRFVKQVDFVNIDDLPDMQVADDAVNDAVARMSSQELVGLIQKLPPVTRTVFNMFVFEGFSHRDIALELNITENTSAWHVNSARTKLKDAISKMYDE